MPNLKNLILISFKNPLAAMYSGLHRIRHMIPIEYHLLNGYSVFPDFITILLTKRCNYKCKKCSAHSPTETHDINAELTTHEIMKFIKEVSFFKPVIYFCGGEPTLREDLFELISYVKSNGMICAMTTNGSHLSEEFAEKIIKSKLDFLSISIDGDREYHDSVRGIRGAYDKVVNGVKIIKKLKNSSPTPHIKLVCIIDPLKVEKCEHVLKVANELMVDEVNFGHLMFYTRNVEDEFAKFREETGIGATNIIGMPIENSIDADVQALKGFLTDIKKKSKVFVSVAQGDVDLIKYYSFNKPSDKSQCFTPWFSAILQPNGNVTPCLEFPIGNIKESPFLKIWNDDNWRKFRMLRKHKPTPACFRCGEGQKIKFD